MEQRIVILPQYKPFVSGSYRYNISYGGRGKGSTWQIARLLLVESLSERHRILCTREHQNSISESVYHTLVSQIEMLGLDDYFRITKVDITAKNGSEFIFKGLKHNVDSIKSMEGVTRCWISEADKIPQDSLDKLFPTIRAEGSKFYIDFNTDSEDDPIYRMFVAEERPDTFVLFQTYKDNPFFPDVLRAEMEWARQTDYDKYLWIWEGKPRAFGDSLVFAGKFIVDDFETPDHAEFYHGVDWGFANDPTTAVRCFIFDQTLHIDQEAYGVGVDVVDTPALFEHIPTLKTWKSIADSARPETISHMRQNGFPLMEGAKKGKGSVEDGISKLRSFKQIVIHPRCKHTLEEFKSYRYKVNSVTGDVLPIVEDKNNHIIDSCRYALEDYWAEIERKRQTTIHRW